MFLNTKESADQATYDSTGHASKSRTDSSSGHQPNRHIIVGWRHGSL